MSKAKQLPSELTGFFQKITDFIFSNPFGVPAGRVEQEFNVPLETQPPSGHHYAALLPLVKQKITQLRSVGINKINDCSSGDQSLVRYVFLFELYDHYTAAFDGLIDAQIRKGVEPVDVPFAQELSFKLKELGLIEIDIARYMSLFYQLRRAHFFISKSLVGRSASMISLRHALWNNIFTADVRSYAEHLWNRMEDFSTLLLGETGTGKGSAATAIGRAGLIPFDIKTGRFKYSFMATYTATNLSQFPESLIESELFGHRKGAFTGAIDNHVGLFERCNPHGALFLDEIGDLSVPVQIKLLNVLQDRQFSPVGGHQSLRFAGRVIGATNKSLDKLRSDGKFRDDFYYRLSSDVINVPSLRDRIRECPDELDELIRLLVERLTGGAAMSVVSQVIECIARDVPKGYTWPGNVRELEQVVRRVILSNQCRISPQDVHDDDWLAAAAAGALSADALLTAYCRTLFNRFGRYEDVANITELNWRTVKKYIGRGDN